MAARDRPSGSGPTPPDVAMPRAAAAALPPSPAVGDPTLPDRFAERAERGRLRLPELGRAEAACRACELYARATQVVPGVGPRRARLMLVGEQPGDREDLAGSPFVGPAGRLLDEVLAEVGIDRASVFLTNVVKHFRWRPTAGGKQRLHERPAQRHIAACRPWLEAELALVQPEALVALGAVATDALLGDDISVTRDHGRRIESPLARVVVVTSHPSAILRARGRDRRAALRAGLAEDLSATLGYLDR